MGARVGDTGELRSLLLKALSLPPEHRAEFLSDSSTFTARQKDSQRPSGPVLPDLLVAMPDFTPKASGIQ
jgi:hypothetical protein